MSENIEYVVNDNLVLISGQSTTGKSYSLYGLTKLPDQSKVLYLNCESGKKLPFPNKFKSVTITDPLDVLAAFDYVQANPDSTDYIIIDSVTFLLDMFESKYVLPSADTRSAWGDYQQFFKKLMNEKVPLVSGIANVVITAHTLTQYNETNMAMETKVPVKGALKNNGIEASFSMVVSTKRMKLEDLKKYENPLLTIDEEEEILGYKHVFQTKLTKETVHERIRSPRFMFSVQESFINNDVVALFQRINDYYAN